MAAHLEGTGAWWLSGKVSALRPEGCRLESHSSRHLGILVKSFTHSCLKRFGVLTPSQYQTISAVVWSASE